jgi:predicted nucleic acid-binding protein
MISYLLDTNHASELLKTKSRLRPKLSRDGDFGICIPSVAELWSPACKKKTG